MPSNLTPTIGETHDAGSQALRRQTTQVLGHLGGLLDGAEIDSYEVWEARHAWRSLIHQLSQLTSTSERWRQSSADVREVDRQPSSHLRIELDTPPEPLSSSKGHPAKA